MEPETPSHRAYPTPVTGSEFAVNLGPEYSLYVSTPSYLLAQNRSRVQKYLILVSIFQTLANLCVKLIGDLPAAQILFIRGIVMFIFGGVYLIVTGKITQFDKIRQDAAISRDLMIYVSFATAAVLCLIYGVSHLPLAESTIIFFLNSIFNGINGAILLGEPYTRFDLIVSLISFLGVILLSKPPFIFSSKDAEGNELVDDYTGMAHFIAALSSLAAAYLFSIGYMAIRRMPKTVDQIVVIFAFNFVTLICSIGINLVSHIFVATTFTTWLVGLLMGISSLLFIYCQNVAFQLEKPSRVATISLGLQLVYTTLIDMLVYFLFPDLISWIGIVLIASGSVLILRAKA